VTQEAAARALLAEGQEILQRLALGDEPNRSERAYVQACDDWQGFIHDHGEELVHALARAMAAHDD